MSVSCINCKKELFDTNYLRIHRIGNCCVPCVDTIRLASITRCTIVKAPPKQIVLDRSNSLPSVDFYTKKKLTVNDKAFCFANSPPVKHPEPKIKVYPGSFYSSNVENTTPARNVGCIPKKGRAVTRPSNTTTPAVLKTVEPNSLASTPKTKSRWYKLSRMHTIDPLVIETDTVSLKGPPPGLTRKVSRGQNRHFVTCVVTRMEKRN